jgi:transcriptional regulator
LSTKSEQLEWRRSKVIELRARGMSQIEIAHELQVSKQLISSDAQYLRNQAKESIKEYVTEHLPEQYQTCLSALDTILKLGSNWKNIERYSIYLDVAAVIIVAVFVTWLIYTRKKAKEIRT